MDAYAAILYLHTMLAGTTNTTNKSRIRFKELIAEIAFRKKGLHNYANVLKGG